MKPIFASQGFPIYSAPLQPLAALARFSCTLLLIYMIGCRQSPLHLIRERVTLDHVQDEGYNGLMFIYFFVQNCFNKGDESIFKDNNFPLIACFKTFSCKRKQWKDNLKSKIHYERYVSINSPTRVREIPTW